MKIKLHLFIILLIPVISVFSQENNDEYLDTDSITLQTEFNPANITDVTSYTEYKRQLKSKFKAQKEKRRKVIEDKKVRVKLSKEEVEQRSEEKKAINIDRKLEQKKEDDLLVAERKAYIAQKQKDLKMERKKQKLRTKAMRLNKKYKAKAMKKFMKVNSK